jgi:hypothetical protein
MQDKPEPKTPEKVRLVIDFPSEQAMVEWFDELRDVAINGFPANTTLYEMDALDQSSVTPKRTYIVRRVGDRPEEFRLTLRTVEVTERLV